MIESHYLANNQKLTDKLRKIPALNLFDTEDFQALMKLSKIRQYKPEEVIITEGDFDCWIYFLISGQVQIEKLGIKLAVLETTGDVFGEMAIIDSTSRYASVLAKQETVCLASDISYIERLTGNEKFRFGYFLFKTLAGVITKRLRENSESIIARHQTIIPPPKTHSDPNWSMLEQWSQNYTEDSYHFKSNDTDWESVTNLILEELGGMIITLKSGDILGRTMLKDKLTNSIAKISRNHARVINLENNWFIEDLDSKNGTYINEKRLSPFRFQQIFNGDTICLGADHKKSVNFTIRMKEQS